MITEDCISVVKQAMITHEVVGNFIKLKRQGTDYKGLCPFHDEKSPSFSVTPIKNFYKCFGCGKSGDGISFLMQHENMGYIEAIKWVANFYNIQIEETGSKKEYAKPAARLEKCSKKVIDWFEQKRAITNNTLLRFNITEAREYMPQLKEEVDTICFNYYRNQELINIKFRGAKKSFKMAKNGELIFYNIDAIKDEYECIITEGEIDCMSLFECGIYNAVSVPNGAAVAGNQRLEYLDNCYGYFDNKSKVTLMVDNDAAGLKLRDELARRIGYDKCFIVDYPDGCKDANDVLVKKGKEDLTYIVENAKPYPIEGVVSMDDMYETVVDFYENGYPQGFSAGIGEFDRLLTFYPGQLTVVTGIPGSGKSEFVDWIMASLAKKSGWNWGICSFENPPEFHVTKLAEKFVNKSFAFRKDPNDRMNTNEFGYAIGMIDKHFKFVNISMVDVTMDGLIAKATELVKRYGINGLLFDPWNCIEHKFTGENETKYVLECLNKLIIFLDKYKVHGILVAHPTKLQKDKSTGKYEVPTLYNISGSAHFFNRTHNGFSIWRDFSTNMVDVHVQKVKWSWLGTPGVATYQFDTMTRMYKQMITGI